MVGDTVELDVIFDGQCGVCTRAARWLVRHDRHARLALHPSQRPGVRERFGLSAEATRTAVWAIDRSGAAYRGAGAINRALDIVLGSGLPSRLYRIPGITALQDLSYRWVAEHRHLLPGTIPWCDRHPDDCGTPTGAAAGSL